MHVSMHSGGAPPRSLLHWLTDTRLYPDHTRVRLAQTTIEPDYSRAGAGRAWLACMHGKLLCISQVDSQQGEKSCKANTYTEVELRDSRWTGEWANDLPG